MSMPKQAGQYTDELSRIKGNVEKAYLYFKPNYDLYNAFRKTVFDTSLDSETIALLKTLKKPQIEFNILEAYISRLRGEFAQQEPSIMVMAGDEAPVDPQTIQVVEGHIKHILDEANKYGCEFQVYTDTLSGGFSVMKVWTEYAHETSFNQVIRLGRAYDPVLCGFDPLAREPHKGDGLFCFELFPKLRDEFEQEHPNIDIEKLTFTKAIEGFNWSYRNEKDDILLICDYYEKKKIKTKIVQLVGGQTMSASRYKEFVKEWQQSGLMEQPPAVIAQRETDIIKIVRTRFIENKVLEQVETDFKMLPLIFVDGNSIIIRNANDKSVMQKTRPYVYHARGIQKLKNFAGQTLANEFENMIQHKFKVAKEAIPLEEDYLQAYRDVQQADVLVYNYNNELAPDKPLPAPEVIQRVPIPPELVNTFVGADNMTQNILGNFDMDISRMNQTQVSGVAVETAATLNNSAAKPYIVNFMQGLGRFAEIALDLIPKYFRTPRTMPVMNPDGKRDYVKINQPQGIKMQYGENALNVRIEPGINFSLQKSKALTTVINMMQASPLFAQFMNTEGLAILLDNLEIKGIDQIKELAKEWQDRMRQMQQQQQNQSNPEIMKMQLEQAKLAAKSQETQGKLSLDMARLKQDMMKIMADLKQSHDSNMIQALKSQTERFAKQVDLELKGHDHNLKRVDQHHRHAKEIVETHHKLNSDKGREHGKEEGA